MGQALEQIEQWKEQVDTDSSHSSKVPSSDSPKSRAERRQKPRSSRAPGVQPEHRKHERAIVAESEVDAVERLFPAGCDHCGGRLERHKEPARRHQAVDLPEVRYPPVEVAASQIFLNRRLAL